jgi:hypothetical protein
VVIVPPPPYPVLADLMCANRFLTEASYGNGSQSGAGFSVSMN